MRSGIALGSNLGDRLANLRAGRDWVMALPGITGPLGSSRIYETEPVGSEPDAGPFLNAVIEVNYEGQPIALMDALQEIEARMGRPSKRPRNAPRTLDLDILYVGNLVLSNDEIVIPHPRLHLRGFVLTPLNDIRPDLILPGQQRNVAGLLRALNEPASVAFFSDSWDA
ncbi:MAG: sulD [Chthoniobacteraceae bacterium]|nr:sulD [Chthoniobacteraceae bacterium]